jgi:hypothetical protein
MIGELPWDRPTRLDYAGLSGLDTTTLNQRPP